MCRMEERGEKTTRDDIMNHAWRAIHRVGENLTLSESEYDEFLEVATEVYQRKLQTASKEYDMDEEYFKFLSEQVFNHDAIIRLINDTAVPEPIISQLENSEFDIAATFEEYTKLDYSLDELVDLIMVLKFFVDYRSITGEESVSRTKLQYLLYLTNDRLSNQEDRSLKVQKTDLGMLERTGYRYTFRKVNNSIKSSRLAQDRNRLIASNLLDETVDEGQNPNAYEPFDLSLGSAGEFLTTRYKNDLTSSNMSSLLLREWSIIQKTIIREWGNKSVAAIENEIVSINSYEQKQNGSVLLTGRTRLFDEDEQEVFEGIMAEVQRAHV